MTRLSKENSNLMEHLVEVKVELADAQGKRRPVFLLHLRWSL